MGIILDTSVLISAEKKCFKLGDLFAGNKKELFYVSSITASELLHGVERAPLGARRKARSQFVETVLSEIEILDFDLNLARQHAKLWAALESSGKMIGAYDLIIAASALHYDFTLATLNRAEFGHVADLRLLDLTPYM